MPGILAIIPRPSGGEWLGDEIDCLADRGVNILVSLLMNDEQIELGLENEAAICALRGIRYVSLPIRDRGVPEDTERFAAVVWELASALRAGKSLAVHCRQSVGRSGLLAVSIAVAVGVTLESAIEDVSAARGVQVPETPAQTAWLLENVIRISGLPG